MSKYISEATRARLRETASYPRRKVTRTIYDAKGNPDYENLECGHRVPVRQDFIGPTFAYSRRCRQCADSAQKENE